MKTKLIPLIMLLTIVLLSDIVAQFPARQDVIWARNIGTATITLDGRLDEAAWARAESLQVRFGQSAGLPTSGWRSEFQPEAYTDPTRAVVKFLAKDNFLYIAFNIPDSSIGGTADWARWDAILMNIPDKSVRTRPVAAAEFFYTYWLAGLANPTPIVGSLPRFVGRFGNFTDTTRTPEQRAAWDAGTRIIGRSNDAGRDTAWVVEMQIDVSRLGYNLTRTAGDIIMANLSIWDADYLFEGVPSRISASRTHWQSPWGNANANNLGRIHVRPDITLTSTLPVVAPDVVLGNAVGLAEPVIDGQLNDFVWSRLPGFQIAWNDTILRQSYSGIGPFISGQFQPTLIPGLTPPILDPSRARIKMFFRDRFLYLSADINDQLVQGVDAFDRTDGIGFIIGHRGAFNLENTMEFRLLRVAFAGNGQARPFDYLPVLIDTLAAEFRVALKGATTVNNNADVDEGYRVEMKIDLTHLGYPANRGDGVLFMGIVLSDGDSFDDSTNNYGTRTWWFREHGGGPAAAWMMMDPNLLLSNVEEEVSILPNSLTLYGNYPNPFNPSTRIKFATPTVGDVSINVFNTIGQLVHSEKLMGLNPGTNYYSFNASEFSSGVYFYRIEFSSSAMNSNLQVRSGKMLLVK